MAERNTMRTNAGRWGWIIPILLLTSLVANILGIILPFLEIDEAFHGKVIYSLPHSVYLMWEHKLYFISGLILGFSIIFPFVKLFSLFALWFIPWKSKNRERYLHVIELLGKWSYMDIFVVILLVTLTSKQSFISSSIHVGVYYFIGAITLSMITSGVIMTLARKTCNKEAPRKFKSDKRRWMLFDNIYLGWIVPVLVLASAATLIESLNATFLRISQMFLVSRSYSISEIFTLMYSQKHWVLLIIMVGTLFVVPLLRLTILLFSWIIPFSPKKHTKVKYVIDEFSRWSMLDVFGLALFLITTEGKDLVKTEIQPGLYIVVAAIGSSYLLAVIAIMLNKAMLHSNTISATSSDTQ
ncbi:MAG: paraquat-inducible protein A [Planctomycetes bacterium]|nr:paraquat-inducible protein A [Planctomycetota bacterium]